MNTLQISKAHHAVSSALRVGRMIRPEACEKCGKIPAPMKDGRSSIQAHHYIDYEHPLDVQWLCVACHRDETPVPYGERAPASKLDWPTVTLVRARYAQGESYYRMARELGVNPKTIYCVIANKSWPESARPLEYENGN